MKNNKKGFTLAELLIVVAIIAVLVAVSIPIFTGQLEKAKIATDQANVRSAKAAALAEYMSEGFSGKKTYYYDATKGRVTVDATGIVGYGKYTKDDKAAEIGASGTPNNNGTANYVIATIDEDGSISMRWSGGLAIWSSIDGTHMTTSNWYSHNSERENSFNKLLETDNQTRKEADIEILKALASYFDGMSASEAEEILGTNRFNLAQKGNNSMLFHYGQDGGGSILINNIDNNNLYYLSDLGYDPKIYVTHSSGWRESENFMANGANNYVDTYLFTSNEMLGSSYKQNVQHNVRIKFKVENGKLTNTEVWVQNLDGQGYTSKN